MTEQTEIPAHRAAITTRSGDTHVIGADGERRNVDQEARDAAAASQPEAAAQAAPAPAPEPARRTRGDSDSDSGDA